MSLLQKSPGKTLGLPPGLKNDNSDHDSGEDAEDDKITAPKLTGGAKPQLKRTSTFYDTNYESVKVSSVPRTTEGWMLFMDLLKTEHRKFKLLLTHLRIERMKILKEFEVFSEAMQNAKKMVQLQFEASMTDLKAVNIPRLLNGEVNKRSSTHIKTPVKPPPKRVSIGSTPTAKTSPLRESSYNSNISSALASVREAFAGDYDERETDSFSDGCSEGSSRYATSAGSVMLSTASERLNRPRIPIEHDEDAKAKRRNRLRKKSMIPTFNVSTQTVDNGGALSSFGKSGISASSRLEKFRKDNALAEQFQYHTRPHALSQPFLGFIRKHEKIYAREIGLMRIALREFKGLYDHLRLRLDTTLNAASTDTVAPELLQSLQQIQLAFNDGAWVFDPKFFIRKVQMNPLEDPLDVAAQAKIIGSYEEAAQETTTEIDAAVQRNDTLTAEHLKEVGAEIGNLLTDLNARAREKGGWRALLYTTKGEVDMNMSLTPWKPEEQVQILLEKLRASQQRAAEAERAHETVVRQLRETIEQAHSKHRPALYASNKPRPHYAHPLHATPSAAAPFSAHGTATATSGRSMSLSGPSAQKPFDQHGHLHGHPNQHEPSDTAPKSSVGGAHRHTLAHVGGSRAALHSAAGRAGLVGIAAEMHGSDRNGRAHTANGEIPHGHGDDRSDAQAERRDHGTQMSVASTESKVTSVNGDPLASDTHVKLEMQPLLETLRSLHVSLESARHQQEQQQDHIRHLHAVIRAQSEQLEARAMASDVAAADGDGIRDLQRDGADGADCDSSLLSQPSQDIIDEYQQASSPPLRGNNPLPGVTALRGPGAPSQAKPFAAINAIGGPVVISAGQAGGDRQRRSSTLVQHRSSAPIEYVPVGKVGATHNLRITVNNELRDHKHLLLRPTSATNFLPGAQPKSFASILAGGSSPGGSRPAPGAKAPINKISQLEGQKRREQALHVLHHGQPVPPIVTGGLLYDRSTNAYTGSPVKADVGAAPPAIVPHVQPPSPKSTRRMSNNTMIKELSAIIDDESSTGLLSLHSVNAGDEEKLKESATDGVIDGPRPAEDVLKSIAVMCEKLQDALVLHSAALKTGQELLEQSVDGKGGSTFSGDDATEAELAGLQIGETGIDQDRSEDHRPSGRDCKRSPTAARDLPPLSPQRSGGKGILQRRPKTAGDMGGGSQESYEDLFVDALGGSTATQKHSDVSVYATTLQNRYLHHVLEAKRLEQAIQRLGKADEADDIKHHQDVAHAHYASQSLFRPQSATASLAGYTTLTLQAPEAPPPHLKAVVPGMRARSASATQSATATARRDSHQSQHKKQRGVTAVPFAKIKNSPSSLDAGASVESIPTPRLHDQSVELSNLSEHELL